MKVVNKTNFNIPGLIIGPVGKVRNTFTVDPELIGIEYFLMLVTDRVSAFDKVLPVLIPFKGQILNLIAYKFLQMAEQNICRTWRMDEKIHPMVTAGLKAKPLKVEMVVRGYLTGGAWRDVYSKGGREMCGVVLPDGMKEFQKFDQPIVTPTTKAENGHDENISPERIIELGLTTKEQYEQMEKYSLQLFEMGSAYARERGLILVDSKYEFGLWDNEIILIDEVNTPDSSRYWFLEGYLKAFEVGISPRALDKEPLRQWLLSQGFKGEPGQKMPKITLKVVEETSQRYLEMYRIMMGEELPRISYDAKDIEIAIRDWMVKKLKILG